ncbi:MAG: flagellar M-ring protein FliF, partial [Schwartzia sp.]|nr:flagellar M-ring protein FliF [Schwartzia sp. (in: firmicutes)]
YEINEEKSKIIASPGSIRRVNIAVLVNDDITRAQQDSILRSVSSAVGINAERGDTVSVEPLPFSTELADRRAAEEAAERARQDRNFYMSVAAGVLLLALIIGAVLLRRRRLRLEREAYEEEQRQLALAEQERLEEERRMEQERAELIAAGQVPEQLVDEEPQLTEDELRTLSEREAIEKLINEKPAEVAMLVKTWLSED